MASQMADCQQDTVSVTVYAGDYRFKASGYTVTFDGFTVLYEEATDEKEKKETSLPPLEKGQVLTLRDDVRRTLPQCREVQCADCRTGLVGTVLDSVLRLLSPLM